jgi:thiol-disulfide isomerase/thioredoxin
VKGKLKYIINGGLVVVLCLLLFTDLGKNLRIWLTEISLSEPEIRRNGYKTLTDKDYLWGLEDSDGCKFTLRQMRGSVIFVNIWATWCGPCIAEMKSIEKLYNRYHDDVVFVILSTEQNWAKVKAFAKEKNYSFPVHRISAGFPKMFQTTTYPTTFVISKNDKLVVFEKGASDWNSKSVRKLMRDLIKEKVKVRAEKAIAN